MEFGTYLDDCSLHRKYRENKNKTKKGGGGSHFVRHWFSRTFFLYLRYIIICLCQSGARPYIYY